MSKDTPNIRRKQFLRCIPEALEFKTLLYIGANVNRLQMIGFFQKAGYKIDVVEIWPENIIALRQWNKEKKVFRHIYQADIRKFATTRKYDVVMWWHGPEHVRIEELRDTLVRLEWFARNLVILGSPWGRWDQDIFGNNPFEIHHTMIYPEMLKPFGYETDTIGKKDRFKSNLLAWKKIR